MLRTAFFCAVAALALAAGPAGAQLWATQLDPGDFYLGVGGNGQYVSLPETKNFMATGPIGAPANNWIDGEDNLWIGGVSGGLGYVFDCDSFGRNLRLEVSGHWAGGDTEEQYAFGPANISLPAVDGVNIGGGTADVPTTARTKLDYTTWGADLLARTDFGEKDGFQVSPFFGFTYSRADRDEEFSFEYMPTLYTAQTDHNLATDHYGGALGATIALPLGSGLWLSVETRADLMYADADLDADQLYANNGVPQFMGERRASAHDSDFAARVGGSVTLSRQFGPVVVGVEGFGSWLSWSPQPIYPVGQYLGPPVPPVRLGNDDAWNAGGGLKVTVPF